MRGRIDDKATVVSNETKRPIILPRRQHVTNIVCDYYHRQFHHGNYETVLNEIRQQYFIPRLRQVLKSIRSRCSHCKVLNTKPNPPEMASLPASSYAAFCKPFTFVGVDCFGPINVVFGRRNEKRWGMIFVCQTIRAIHIEIAHSLSTDSCLICLRNLIARRGKLSVVISDHGTNFHELKRALQGYGRGMIEWRFNPPATPHMCGS